MSMHAVEYTGYGFDFERASLNMASAYPDSSQRIQSFLDECYDITEVAGDVAVITPCNTDDFGCLLMICSVVPVGGAEVKVYGIPEANAHLVDAACELLNYGIGEGYIMQEDIEAARAYLSANAAQLFDYSWNIGPFTDLV